MKFARLIADRGLRAHLSHETGVLHWKHLSAVVIAFHTAEWCVRMHFVAVPCGEVFVMAVLHTFIPLQYIAAFFGVATLLSMRLDALVGIATRVELAVSWPPHSISNRLL